jgi:TatD DNase family protein
MARRRGEWPADPEPLPVPVIDNHTHLESIPDVLEDGVPDPGVVGQLDRAAAVGVEAVVQIGCDLESVERSVAWAHEHPRVVAGVAIHPNEAVLHAGVREIAPDGLEPDLQPRHATSLDDAIARVAELARDPRVRTVGETGLDYFRAGERGRQVQRASFRAHLALAKELGLPLQIHDRDAHRDVLEVLEADGAPERTVFHCFSGDAELARTCNEHGWYMSFSGTVTFKNSHDLKAALRAARPELVLVETDAPFLTPHPYRGRPNASYVTNWTVRGMAEILEQDLEQLCERIWANTAEVYGAF